MIVETLVVGDMGVNCYVVWDEQTREALIIDPGADAESIKDILRKKRLSAKFIINTHGHIDHIGADAQLGLPIWIHKDDADFLDDSTKNLSAFFASPQKVRSPSHLLEDKEKIKLGGVTLEVLHTPGHTPGGICLAGGGIVFSGDTLFFEGIGRTDFPYGSSPDLLSSIKDKLMSLPDDTLVYPGHGPQTTIGRERKNNPFL